jgi:hypothetical protein
MLQAIFGRNKRRKAETDGRNKRRTVEIDAFWDGVRDNFHRDEMRNYPVMFRRNHRELAEMIADPENAPDLPFLIALHDSHAVLLAEMESQLPWTSIDQCDAFASRSEAETRAILERFRPEEAKAFHY